MQTRTGSTAIILIRVIIRRPNISIYPTAVVCKIVQQCANIGARMVGGEDRKKYSCSGQKIQSFSQ